MEHLFIPKNLEVIAIQKGFAEPTLKRNTTFHYPNTNYVFADGGILYQQIVDWFREKYDIQINIIRQNNSSLYEINISKDIQEKYPKCHYSYYEAYNEAIKQAFKLI